MKSEEFLRKQIRQILNEASKPGRLQLGQAKFGLYKGRPLGLSKDVRSRSEENPGALLRALGASKPADNFASIINFYNQIFSANTAMGEAGDISRVNKKQYVVDPHPEIKASSLIRLMYECLNAAGKNWSTDIDVVRSSDLTKVVITDNSASKP
jgi:hypothetical protein